MDRRTLLRGATGTAGLLSILALNSQLQAQGAMARQRSFRQGFVDHALGQIYYWSVGQGPVVTCIHQSGNSADEYAALIPLLADRCRLVALDLPGHGRSANPEREPSVEDYTSATLAVLDALDISTSHLVGHHGGALTAMNVAGLAPERVGKTLLSGIGGLRNEAQTQAFIDRLLATDTNIRAESDFVADAWDRYINMMSDGGDVTDMVRPFVAFLDARLRPYRGVLINLRWQRRADAISKLRGPVLLVQGEKDEFVSEQEQLLDLIPSSRRVALPGCGTFMFYDRAQTCADVISEFLDLA